jgi:hypothetical protein
MTDTLAVGAFVSPLRLPELDAEYLKPSAELELVGAMTDVQVRRQLRGKCAVCGLRRVLYRIAALMAGGVGATEARCAPCWGIRE